MMRLFRSKIQCGLIFYDITNMSIDVPEMQLNCRERRRPAIQPRRKRRGTAVMLPDLTVLPTRGMGPLRAHPARREDRKSAPPSHGPGRVIRSGAQPATALALGLMVTGASRAPTATCPGSARPRPGVEGFGASASRASRRNPAAPGSEDTQTTASGYPRFHTVPMFNKNCK